VTGGTPDTSGLPGTDPVILSSGAGVGTLTFGSGTGLFFTRTTPTAPASPYDADISLAINVIDADGVTYASNPSRFGTATASNGIAFSDGNALTTNDKQMRFGRLVIRNVNGSQLVPLPVQVEAQYWSGAPTNAFITNAQDSCTSIASANDAMGSYTSNLSGSPTCETAISGGGTLSAGRKTLQLAAPGSGNNGSVDLAVNLGASASGNTCTTLGGAPVSATTANLPHLQGNWTGGAYNVNPSARATFGVFKGAEEIIFVRENF
jgi:MSHA biogenesis protein MshQ